MPPCIKARSVRLLASHHALRQYRLPYSTQSEGEGKSSDPRIQDLGRAIEDDYATIREKYETPKNPVVLAHGLLGFDELHLAGSFLPGVQYWRGITEALTAKGIQVITASVSASGSIEGRADGLGREILQKANGKSVNIVAHRVGSPQFIMSFTQALIDPPSGLDARYMISRLKPKNVNVLSLTTIATPHRGSAFADYCFEQIGKERLPKVYKLLEACQMETGAFSQLTQKYLREEFNNKTPDLEGVRYFSYGATFEPSMWSLFRQSHRIVQEHEGPNDGLVSVASSKWGGGRGYKGTLVGVSHLDLINWTNQLRWLVWELTGRKRKFNAIAFYLDIADMLAREGL
ncbi:MAG: hypothetical protein M1833_005606 [Piccolia ochrophora]|nr:MAG: hypothetical protein M1833_005606 [Piccolia ochrophora]